MTILAVQLVGDEANELQKMTVIGTGGGVWIFNLSWGSNENIAKTACTVIEKWDSQSARNYNID